jgi:hypothetical protein
MCDFRDPPTHIKISDDEIKQVEFVGYIPQYKVREINNGHFDPKN